MEVHNYIMHIQTHTLTGLHDKYTLHSYYLTYRPSIFSTISSSHLLFLMLIYLLFSYVYFGILYINVSYPLPTGLAIYLLSSHVY